MVPSPFFFVGLFLFAVFPTPEFSAAGLIHDSDAYSVVLILHDTYADFSEISGEVARYNNRSYSTDRPRTRRFQLNDPTGKRRIVYVGDFSDLSNATRYCAELVEQRPDFMREGLIRQIFPISNRDLGRLSESGLPEYLKRHHERGDFIYESSKR